MRILSFGLLFLLPALLLASKETLDKPLRIETQGWVTTLREDYLSQEIEAEIYCRDQPLDEAVSLLAGALPSGTSVLFKTRTAFPTITGRLSGHPLRTIERLLSLHGYEITEREGIFVVEEITKQNGVYNETHYIVGPRLLQEDTERISLGSVLDKARLILAIPERAECRITDQEGRTIGWQENNSLLAKRVRYIDADNGFFVTGTRQEHQWFEAVLTAANRDVTPLLVSFAGTGVFTHAHTRQIVKIGTESREHVTFERNLWKLKNEGGALVPVSSQRSNEKPIGSIVTFWAEEQPNGRFLLHIQNRDDVVLKGILNRKITGSETIVSPGETFRLRVGMETVQLVLNTEFTLRQKIIDVPIEIAEVKRQIKQLGR